ncbi:MAG: peptide chain release factor N(5)-glutamine methyltransferase [Candidatus Aminicenantes bacterium]|nr:MAG: peptide chain release factor N(5)-glutamine methyltransferase [Candidatus Aminicenantes bacterium]
MLYSQLYSRSLKKFKDKDKSLDLQILTEAAFRLTRHQFWIKKNEEITDHIGLRKFYRYRKRLLQDEPIAYILKRKEFYGETFYINKNVLIPRPETEILVEHAIESINKKPANILDIGAGSGVIAILLARHTGAAVTAVEKSRSAFYVLKKNIALHGMTGKVTPVCGDLFPAATTGFDMIVSNPPYVSEAEWQELDPNVKNHEPKEALVAGEDGLLIIRRIAAIANYYLNPGGKLLMEIGYNQEEPVRRILESAKFSKVEFFKDYSGVSRVVLAKLAE